MRRNDPKDFVKKMQDKWGKEIVLLDEYKNRRTKIKYFHCECGRTHEKLPFNLLKSGCSLCSLEERNKKTVVFNKESKSLTQEDFLEIINQYEENKDFEIISDYENNASKIVVFHKTCKKYMIKSAQTLKRGPIICDYCKKISFEEAKELINKKHPNIDLLGEYISWNEKALFYCKECKKEYYSIPIVVYNEKYGCKLCAQRSKLGENSPLWKGGKSSLMDFSRRAILSWKYKSLEYYGGVCIISGSSENLEVHHVFQNFLNIIKNVLERLQLNIEDLQMSVQDYLKTQNLNQDDLLLYRKEIIKENFKIGYGVPLTKELHREFHNIYGERNNTVNQLIEFAESKGVKLKLEDKRLVRLQD